MNSNIPHNLMDNVEKNLKRHIVKKRKVRLIQRIAAIIAAVCIVVPVSAYAFGGFTFDDIMYRKEIDLACKNNNITKVNQVFKYKDVKFTIKEIFADDTNIEVIYEVSDPRYTVNEITLGDKNNKKFKAFTGYSVTGNDTKEKSFEIRLNNEIAEYMHNNAVTININSIDFKNKTGLLGKKINVKWALKMKVPMQEVKVIPVNKEYSLDIGKLKINSIKICVLKTIVDFTFESKDKNVESITPIIYIRSGSGYLKNNSTMSTGNQGTMEFESIYYNKADDIGINLTGAKVSYRFSNTYKIDKNNLPKEYDFNGEKFKIVSVKQNGSFDDYNLEFSNANRIYSNYTFGSGNPLKSKCSSQSDHEKINYKDQALRDEIYNKIASRIPSFMNIDKLGFNAKEADTKIKLTLNKEQTEFEIKLAEKSLIYGKDEVIVHK